MPRQGLGFKGEAHMTPGYFSLIQFCPDPSRLEAANIGVLLFCPSLGFLDVKFSEEYSKVKRFFGAKKIDFELIDSSKESLRARMRIMRQEVDSLEGLTKFIDTRANELKITKPRAIKINEPGRELESLYVELVQDNIVRRKKSNSIIPEIDRYFHHSSLTGRIRYNQKVVIPVVRREIKIPYAFQNGALNLITPQKFNMDSQGFQKALSLACEGDLLQKHQSIDGYQYKFIIIPVVDTTLGHDVSEEQIENVFKHYSIRIVKPAQLPSFIKEVEEIAH